VGVSRFLLEAADNWAVQRLAALGSNCLIQNEMNFPRFMVKVFDGSPISGD
jgi:hypothetical protein